MSATPMTTTLWLVAVLSLSLPAPYRLADSSSERVAMPGPPGQVATQEFRRWTAPGGKALHLFHWLPRPPRDLGPMAVRAEWPATVAGQDTRIIETTMFMGRPQRVLVTYLVFTSPTAQVMIYATGMEREEFEAVLAGIRRADVE